jgi:hypothetical protein
VNLAEDLITGAVEDAGALIKTSPEYILII